MPFQAERPHQYWSVDIRYLDMHTLGGGHIYAISILDNYSRAIVASVVSRTQDLTAFLLVLYAAIRHHGSPDAIVSDGGAVFKADQALLIYQALRISKQQIKKRKPWQNYIETTFSIMRRMADWHFEQAKSWSELVTVHDQWVLDYNYQEHWAHQQREDGRRTPWEVLNEVCGSIWEEADLQRIFMSTRFRRMLDRAGYLRFRHWRIYAEYGLSGQQVVLWFSPEHLTVTFADQMLAHYTLKLAADQHEIQRLTKPRLVETVFQTQLALWELSDEEWLKVMRVRRPQQAGDSAPSPLIQQRLFA
jgi:hypothetical protein